jgi:hypothetical protein
MMVRAKGNRKKKREVERDHTRYRKISTASPSLGSSLHNRGLIAQEEDFESKSKEARLYRQGLSKRTISADIRFVIIVKSANNRQFQKSSNVSVNMP